MGKRWHSSLSITHVWILLAFLTGAWLAACAAEKPAQKITEVIYTATSGTILPELQWHEAVFITQDKVTFSRSGRMRDTTVNAGIWEIAVPEAEITALFELLETVDRSIINEYAPQDAPDGGGSASFTLRFSDGKEFVMNYAAGVLYTHSDPLVKPILEYIASLPLPAEAASRYKE